MLANYIHNLTTFNSLLHHIEVPLFVDVLTQLIQLDELLKTLKWVFPDADNC